MPTDRTIFRIDPGIDLGMPRPVASRLVAGAEVGLDLVGHLGVPVRLLARQQRDQAEPDQG